MSKYCIRTWIHWPDGSQDYKAFHHCELAVTLLDASIDKDILVQEQILNSLSFMGEAELDEVLLTCSEYLARNEKLAPPQRVLILRAIEMMVRTNLEALEMGTAKMIILQASSEMTRSKELAPEWQQAASNVLVAVGKRFTNSVMEEMLTKFQPGVLPQYYVMQTLANLSTTSVFGMVPFLNSILCTLLPMLGLAKQDQMKIVFSTALQNFSESIQEYLANLDKAPDPTVRKDTFSNEIFQAFDLLFSNWLQSREIKVRLAVIGALGQMAYFLPNEKLEEQLPRLIPVMLSFYKKHAESFYISKSLCQILEASVNLGSRSLEMQLDPLLMALHFQISNSLDSNSSLVVKNHNEVLRCFSVLACSLPDRILAFLLPKLENNNEKLQMGTLIILRQVVNSASIQMESKRPLILASMKVPLQSSNNKVRRSLVQVISAMAHHGYLNQTGGEVLVEYIIRLCALPVEAMNKRLSLDADDLPDESVRKLSVDTLWLLSTTVEHMSTVLWPYLLEFVVPTQYTSALTPVCKSLTHLAKKQQEGGIEAFLLSYRVNVNFPSPCALVTRLLVVSSRPYQGEGQGMSALHLLRVMQPNIHVAVEELWEEAIPRLLEHLEGNTEKTLLQKDWEEKLLLFLEQTLLKIKEGNWICHLAQEMSKHLNDYNKSPSEKDFLYRCIGTVLKSCPSKEEVKKQLQELLMTARYQEDVEREGLACAIGICAVNHFDETLTKLEEFHKSDVLKKNMMIFSLFKDRNENELEKVKSALILCYGYIALFAQKELLLARIEADILRNILQYFYTKDLTLKLCLVRSISMLSLAVCESNKASSFFFSRKAELVAQMIDFIKAEPLESVKSPLRQKAIACCSYLVKLEPSLSHEETSALLSTCLGSVFALPALKEKEGCSEVLYLDTMDALKELLKSVLLRKLSPVGLQEMFQHLSIWIRSPKEHERERAMNISTVLLEFYFCKLHIHTVVPFHNLGLLIGLLSPRCSDSLATIRQQTLDCIYYLLYIQQLYGGFAQDHTDELIEKLKPLRRGLETPDSNFLFHTCFQIAMIISKRLPPDQLISLLFITLDGLSDPDSNCSRAASVMVNCLLKDRGTVLLEKVPDIMLRIQNQLEKSGEEHMKKAAVQTLHILASQHSSTVVRSLLSCALPFDSSSALLWRALASDQLLTTQILELLLEQVTADVPYKESKGSILSSTTSRVATRQPFAATCALSEILSVAESMPAVLNLYPQLFVSLLLRISCMVGVLPPKNLEGTKEKKGSSLIPVPQSMDPCSSAVDTLQLMLTRGGSEEVTRSVESWGGWERMKNSDQHHDGVSLLASAMAKHAGPRLPAIVKALIPAISSLYVWQRVSATAFFAELLSCNVVNDLMLLEMLMDNMTGREKDSCVMVRMLAVRGLGNMADGSPEKVGKHGSQLLASMINAMDDKDDPNNVVTLEATSGLTKLLPHVLEKDIRSVLIHIAIRVRPFFDSEDKELRKSSILLFGNLTKYGQSHGEEDVFFDQILSGLVTLLLHLQDPTPDVVKASKFALRMCTPSMGCNGVNEMCQKHLHENRVLHYGEFLNHICKYLMQDYPDMLNRLIMTNLSYLKSIWPDMRAAAAMFIGFLVLHMQKEHYRQLELEHVMAALVLLLKDPVPAVRIKAVETLGRLVRLG
uniref:Maestro heat-like repeat-containing protein family member 1 isoform X2 n=1 Tax=Geotrypetes seraphini TaxID=260995 RepID=A0A6P8Q2F3_GEOSA|nr:maestro heat-like repeat-containing protein family member 1 isoform X2 [Geotrypetes seraphini]